MNNFRVTLADLRKHEACYEGYNKVVRSIKGVPFTVKDEDRESYIKFSHKHPISLISIAENNGLDDAIWATRCLVGEDRNLRLYAVWCARRVQHLMTNPRSLKALDVAESFANGNASLEELRTAWGAAWDGSLDAACSAARDAALDAACAAARAAALDAAWAAARAAALDAAWDAAWDVARDAAWAAARDAARDAEWAAQKEMFIKMCKGQAPWQHTTKEV